MGSGKICKICGKEGHNKRFHSKDKCSICHGRGHKAPTCEQGKEQVFMPEKQIPTLPEGFSERRESTKALTKRERNMIVRMLHGLYTLKAEGKLSESVITSAIKLSGVGKGKIIEINNALVSGKVAGLRKGKRGTFKRKECHRDILVKINDTIEKLHKTGTMTSTKKILRALNFYHGINELSKKVLIKLLHKMGYTYRKPSAGNVLLAIENEAMRETRLKYLRAIKQAREEGKEIVYLDESYVNDRHQQNMCWVKKGSQVYVPSGRGPRYILYGAGSRNGWVETPTVFAHKDGSKDYHTGMNGQHFEELFLKTCIAAKDKLKECLIIMDNAAYHRRPVDERCRMTFWNLMPAEKMKEMWENGEIPGQDKNSDGDMKYKKDIIQWLRKNLPKGETRVEAIARQHGHKVLMLPPYRPELNAIETAWGVSKNYVARNNSAQMTFKNLIYTIDRGMEQVTLAVWSGLDAKVKAEETRQLEYLESDQSVRDQFRAANPDLAFTVTADDSDDDSADEGVNRGDQKEDNTVANQVLAAVSEGVDGSDEDLADILRSGTIEGEVHKGNHVTEVINRGLTSVSNSRIREVTPSSEPCSDAQVPVVEIPDRDVEDLLYFFNSISEAASSGVSVLDSEANNMGQDMERNEEPSDDAIVPVMEIPDQEIKSTEDLHLSSHYENKVGSDDAIAHDTEASIQGPGLVDVTADDETKVSSPRHVAVDMYGTEEVTGPILATLDTLVDYEFDTNGDYGLASNHFEEDIIDFLEGEMCFVDQVMGCNFPVEVPDQ